MCLSSCTRWLFPPILHERTPVSNLLLHFYIYVLNPQYKLAVIAALVASASAFAPSTRVVRSTASFQHVGAGGMADTRDPEPFEDEDPRKSISAAPSFEEYLKQREAEGK